MISRLQRFRLRFTGVVQHVGFRYETLQIATSLHLTGWVKNRTDRSVEAEVQGYPEAIDQLIRELKAVPYFDIKSCQKTKIPPVDGESGFHIA